MIKIINLKQNKFEVFLCSLIDGGNLVGNKHKHIEISYESKDIVKNHSISMPKRACNELNKLQAQLDTRDKEKISVIHAKKTLEAVLFLADEDIGCNGTLYDQKVKLNKEIKSCLLEQIKKIPNKRCSIIYDQLIVLTCETKNFLESEYIHKIEPFHAQDIDIDKIIAFKERGVDIEIGLKKRKHTKYIKVDCFELLFFKHNGDYINNNHISYHKHFELLIIKLLSIKLRKQPYYKKELIIKFNENKSKHKEIFKIANFIIKKKIIHLNINFLGIIKGNTADIIIREIKSMTAHSKNLKIIKKCTCILEFSELENPINNHNTIINGFYIDEEFYTIFTTLLKRKMDPSFIKINIQNKSLTITKDILRKLLDKKTPIEEKMSEALNAGAIIKYYKNNIIIIAIQNFKQSMCLSSSKWCISHNIKEFNKYLNYYPYLYFVYDYNYDQNDKRFLTGISIKNENKITLAFDQDNNNITDNNVIRKYKPLIKDVWY